MRLGRSIRRAALFLPLSIVFVLSFAVGVLLHLDVAPARRIVVANANAWLAGQMRGAIRIERLGALGLRRVSDVDVSVRDPEGAEVLRIQGASAWVPFDRIAVFALRGGLLRISLPRVSVRNLEVRVHRGLSGELGVVRAFEPRFTAPLGPPSEGAVLEVRSVRLEHAKITGDIAPDLPVDADIQAVEGAVLVGQETKSVAIARAYVDARGLVPFALQGRLSGSFARSEKGIEGAAGFEGRTGTAFGELFASFDEERLRMIAHASVAAGQVALSADARRGEGGALGSWSASARFRDLDLRALSADAPASLLTGRMVAKGIGLTEGIFDLDTERGLLAGVAVPASRVTAAQGENEVTGRAMLAEEGAPIDLRFQLRRRSERGKFDELTFEAQALAEDLGKVRRLEGRARGRARVVAKAEMDLAGKTVCATGSLSVSGGRAEEFDIESSHVDFRLAGPFDAPVLVAEVKATSLAYGGRRIPHARARVKGTPRALAVSLELDGGASEPNVRANAQVTSLSPLSLRDFEVTMARDEIAVAARARAVRLEVGGFTVEGATVEGLGGPVSVDASLSRSRASVHARGRHVDLGRLSKLLGHAEQVKGSLRFDADFESKHHGDGWTPPRGELGIEADVDLGELLHRVSGHEPARLEVLATSRESGTIDVVLRMGDERGLLASIDGVVSVDRRPASLADAPFDLNLRVPRRAIADFPVNFGVFRPRGDIEIAASVRGTWGAPEATADLLAFGLSVARGERVTPPLDVRASATAGAERSEIRASAFEGSREVLQLSARGHGSPWEVSGRASLDAFPLEVVGALWDRPIGGRATGTAEVRDLPRAPTAFVELSLAPLTIARLPILGARMGLRADSNSLRVQGRIDQTNGLAEGEATLPLVWTEGLVPEARLEGASASLSARNFRIDALLPFAGSTLDALDGRIDGWLRLQSKDGSAKAGGELVLRDGMVEVPVMGERFEGVRARATVLPDGTMRIEDIAAHVGNGRLLAAATIQFRGLEFVGAAATLRVPGGEAVTLAFQGVPLGRIEGDTEVRVVPSADALLVNISTPKLHVDLPGSKRTAVQSLDPDDHVRVGVVRGGRFHELPLRAPERVRSATARRVRIAVELGRDVVVERRNLLSARIEGAAVIDVYQRARLAGTLRIASGTIDVGGKRFTIDYGAVSFSGTTPSNPVLVATASWEAPDGTRVQAHFAGPVKTGKLTLSSEPARSQDEIVALVLFGSADGQLGVNTSPDAESSGTPGLGVAAGVLVRGLNAAVRGITNVDIEARVDTSQAQNPRPELGIQLTKELTAEIAYSLGVPPPGQNPDRMLLRLDFRFVRNWSLLATIGDQGSASVDVLWRFRY